MSFDYSSSSMFPTFEKRSGVILNLFLIPTYVLTWPVPLLQHPPLSERELGLSKTREYGIACSSRENVYKSGAEVAILLSHNKEHKCRETPH